MISVNRIRDNVTPEHPLFEDDQGLGPFLPSLFQQIVNNGIRLVLTDHAGQPFNLVTQGDWNELLARYLTSSQAPTTDRCRSGIPGEQPWNQLHQFCPYDG